MRLFVLTRHAHSTLNLEQRVNGDPTATVGLTDQGVEEARALGLQLAQLPLDACVTTRFGRTSETARLALGSRRVAFRTEPLLDDIDVGSLEGSSIEDYRAWKRAHTRAERFPGGESLDEAAARYAQAFRRLAGIAHQRALVICHEIPIRYALNAAAGAGGLDGPVHDVRNATPYCFDDEALLRAADGIERILAL